MSKYYIYAIVSRAPGIWNIRLIYLKDGVSFRYALFDDVTANLFVITTTTFSRFN